MNINENKSKKYIIKNDYILATDLRNMFYGCSSLLSITGLSKIKTSNAINMEHMFEDCTLIILKILSNYFLYSHRWYH